MINPLVGMPQGLEWVVILAIVVLVFGAAKLPDLARSSGQALRIFKTETKDLRDNDKPSTGCATTPPVTWCTSGATTPPPDPGEDHRSRRPVQGPVTGRCRA